MASHVLFGPFALNVPSGTLLRGKTPVKVSHRGLLLLAALTARPSEVLTKSDLMNAAWPGLAVQESNLSVQIACLRRVLGPSPDGTSWISTVPRAGYRFNGLVRQSMPAIQVRLPRADRAGLIILPFRDLSLTPSGLCDPLVQQINVALTRFSYLRVSTQSEDCALTSRQNRGFLLNGSIQQSGRRVRVVARLIEAAGMLQVWTECYDRTLRNDLLGLQAALAELIACAIADRIEQIRLQRAISTSVDRRSPSDLLWCGISKFRGIKDGDNREACDILERVLTLDCDLVLAKSYLANARVALHGYGSAPAHILQEEAARAGEAVDLEPWNGRCHRMLGHISLYARDYDTAEYHFGRALALNPGDPDAWASMASVLTRRRKPTQALRFVSVALQLRPTYPLWYNHHLGLAFYSAGRAAQALQVFKRLRTSERAWQHSMLAASYARLGAIAEAQQQVCVILHDRPDYSIEEFLQTNFLMEHRDDTKQVRQDFFNAGLQT